MTLHTDLVKKYRLKFLAKRSVLPVLEVFFLKDTLKAVI